MVEDSSHKRKIGGSNAATCTEREKKFKKDYIKYYTTMIKHGLLIYTSMKHSILLITFKVLVLHSLDTLSNVRIKAFTLLF